MVKSEESDMDLYWGIVDSIIHDKNKAIHPHLRRVDSGHSFKLKKSEYETLAECFFLSDLRDAIIEAPVDVLEHHLREGNDFAMWVRESVGDISLSRALERIDPEDTQVKEKILNVLNFRLKHLKVDSVNLLFE